jgi:hypothetical protein
VRTELFAVGLGLVAVLATSAVVLAAGPNTGGEQTRQRQQLGDGSCIYVVE